MKNRTLDLCMGGKMFDHLKGKRNSKGVLWKKIVLSPKQYEKYLLSYRRLGETRVTNTLISFVMSFIIENKGSLHGVNEVIDNYEPPKDRTRMLTREEALEYIQ